jgi:hypothetical protein
MPDVNTTHLGLIKPEVGSSNDTWGGKHNTNQDTLDALFAPSGGHGHTGVAGQGSRLTPGALEGVAGDGLIARASGAAFVNRVLTGAFGVGVSNGNGVAGNPTVVLDIPGLAELTEPDSADLVPVHDASVGAPRRVSLGTLTQSLVNGPDPAVSVDNTLVRFDGTTGRVLQGSLVTVDDSGNLNMADAQVRRPVLRDYGLAFQNLGAGSGAQSIDLEAGNYAALTVNGNVTISFANPPASGVAGSLLLELTNAGSFTVTWPASVRWPAGLAPVLTLSGVDVLVFITRDGGVTWRGVLVMGNSA